MISALSALEGNVPSDQVSISELVGATVQDESGGRLGRVEDVVVDRSRGCVAYLVLSLNGAMAFGGMLFAVPWQALRFRSRDKVVLSLSRQTLENAPAFDRERARSAVDREWLRDLYIFYGQSPYWEES